MAVRRGGVLVEFIIIPTKKVAPAIATHPLPVVVPSSLSAIYSSLGAIHLGLSVPSQERPIWPVRPRWIFNSSFFRGQVHIATIKLHLPTYTS